SPPASPPVHRGVTSGRIACGVGRFILCRSFVADEWEEKLGWGGQAPDALEGERAPERPYAWILLAICRHDPAHVRLFDDFSGVPGGRAPALPARRSR